VEKTDANTYMRVTAKSTSANDTWQLTMGNGVWGNWEKVNDGGNADTVDGKHAIDFVIRDGGRIDKFGFDGTNCLHVSIDGSVHSIPFSSKPNPNGTFNGTATGNLPLTGGALSGTFSAREYLNVYAGSSNAETYSSFIQNANSTHVRHVTDANNFDEFFIRKGKITYAKMVNGAWSEVEVFHGGNSSPVVPTNVDPGVGASVTYADGTVIFVYEEE
jgi:hypothetical protein